MNREAYKEKLQELLGISTEEVNNMSNLELVDAGLKYEGIIGYTEDILRLVEIIFDVDLHYKDDIPEITEDDLDAVILINKENYN